MSSPREFVRNELVPAIVKDAKDCRIFNEADLQASVAYHLRRRYVGKHINVVLRNQPSIRIGIGRGTATAKPDIVLCDVCANVLEPFAAFELKCYLENADTNIRTIEAKIRADIEKLRKFGQRPGQQYAGAEYVFFLALLDVTDLATFEALERSLTKTKERWMAHFLIVHLVNVRSRIRGYDGWANRWLSMREL